MAKPALPAPVKEGKYEGGDDEPEERDEAVRRVDKLEDRVVELLRLEAARPRHPCRLDRPGDVLALLAEQANALRGDGSSAPLDKARALGSLAAAMLRAIGDRDLDARLEAVERVLKLRRDEERESERRKRRR